VVIGFLAIASILSARTTSCLSDRFGKTANVIDERGRHVAGIEQRYPIAA